MVQTAAGAFIEEFLLPQQRSPLIVVTRQTIDALNLLDNLRRVPGAIALLDPLSNRVADFLSNGPGLARTVLIDEGVKSFQQKRFDPAAHGCSCRLKMQSDRGDTSIRHLIDGTYTAFASTGRNVMLIRPSNEFLAGRIIENGRCTWQGPLSHATQFCEQTTHGYLGLAVNEHLQRTVKQGALFIRRLLPSRRLQV